MRQLGIPTVVDRLIQQSLNQVLSPIFDQNFSNSSYRFRLLDDGSSEATTQSGQRIGEADQRETKGEFS